MQDNLFFQKYKYIKSLGKGGCGEVFLAENKNLRNYWAVKEIPKDRKTSVSGYIEPEILKRLNHPALPRICDVYEDEAKIYIIEDYIEGVCLLQELELKGKFEENEIIELGIQLCSVLVYLHGQKPDPIIYGDMKPHNIILTKDGFVKLIDFGVSSFLKNDDTDAEADKTLPAETVFIGTKGYAAPEQYLEAYVSPGTDIYSLGITLIQLISDINPLNSIQSYYNDEYKEYMSPGLFRILHKCIQSSPELRYQRAEQLMKELQDLRLNNINKPPGIVYDRRSTYYLTRIFAFAGTGGTGVSTITAAVAAFVAKGSQPVCIVDLSENRTLEKSLAVKGTTDSAEPVKITADLYYLNLGNLKSRLKTYPDDHTDPLILYKHFSKLQTQFSSIFVDAELSILKLIEHFVNHIFLVCDMNPYNISGLGARLDVEVMASDLISGASFIINKFYKGELSSYDLLQSIFQSKGNEEHLQKLISLSRKFEVPYDQGIYLEWMYSGFGEPLKFGRLLSDRLEKAISCIVTEVIQPPGARPHMKLKQLIKSWG